MKTAPHASQPSLPAILGDAIRYWEPRRLGYNVALAVVVIGRAAAAWTYARGQLDFEHLLALFVLAVLGNVCYCAAYVVDVPMQVSMFHAAWRRRRWMLWTLGTLFGMALAWFWIGDEMLPALH